MNSFARVFAPEDGCIAQDWVIGSQEAGCGCLKAGVLVDALHGSILPVHEG